MHRSRRSNKIAEIAGVALISFIIAGFFYPCQATAAAIIMLLIVAPFVNGGR